MSDDSSKFKHLSVTELHQQQTQKNTVVLDVRDATSFASNHIPGAIHLTNESLADFMRDADLDAPTVVCCYHGISSQQAAQYLISQDFTDVYSLDGGFTEWQNLYPNNTESQ